MNCQDFQAAIGASPHSSDPEVMAHAAQCPACARYRQELQEMDALIHRALSMDVPPMVARPPAWRRPAWALAASVLATVSVALAILLAGSGDTFAEQIVAHVEHEAFSMVRTSDILDEAELARILQPTGLRLKAGVRVSYASVCPFRGTAVPHLIVQTDQGPVTLMILENETAPAQSQWFEEDGFRGVILRAPRGAVAVLSQPTPGQDVDLAAIASNLRDAVQYGW